MDRVKFNIVKTVLVSLFIVILSAVNFCLANVIPISVEDLASGIRSQQLHFSENLTIIMKGCNSNNLPADKKDQCIINLKSKLSESKRLHIVITDQLKEFKEAEKDKSKGYKLKGFTEIKPRPYRVVSNPDFSTATKYLQQALKGILEDQKKIINNLKLLGVKENLSINVLNNLEREMSSASKLSLFGIIFFMSCIGLFLIKRNAQFRRKA